jgi:hypothetical protein
MTSFRSVDVIFVTTPLRYLSQRMTRFAMNRACCVRIASLLPLLIAFLLPQALLLLIWALSWLLRSLFPENVFRNFENGKSGPGVTPLGAAGGGGCGRVVAFRRLFDLGPKIQNGAPARAGDHLGKRHTLTAR